MIQQNSILHEASTDCRVSICRTAINALRQLKVAYLFAMGLGALATIQSAACADEREDPAAAAQDGATMMQRYVVSATRIEKNPWRYASLPGFEVLSRASDEKTNWWLDALRRGLWIENAVLPRDWLPQSSVPDTVIIDDTDLETIPSSQLHSQAIKLHAPEDALTWGRFSGKANIWSDRFDAHDQDTYAINSDVYGVDIKIADCVMGLGRVYHCAPSLPRWLISGMLGRNCGGFRESFMPILEDAPGALIRRAEGPGTLWGSLDETQRLLKLLKKDKKTKIVIPPLSGLFAEVMPPDENPALWESEAGLFVRWGLMGPGQEDPAMSRAFVELVRRARREPVTERVFTECFGYGYAAMEVRLESFLKVVLAQPTSVSLEMPYSFPEAEMKPATADQIGRILGDWLRMQGENLRGKDPEMSAEFLRSSGRMLERAYREDNGLPPDASPMPQRERPANPSQNAVSGSVVVMKPFVVTATHIHDQGLLAVYGMYERDAGNDDKAREFLEAAVKAGVVRPRAYFALATLRYAEAAAKPLGAKGRLSAEQAALILEPLQGALGSPPASDAYGLFVQTLERCESHVGNREIEKLVEGVALFPRYTALAYHSALVCAQSGFIARANAMTDSGLEFATDKSSRHDFERLRSILGTASLPSIGQ
jgi:hypothetical protein